MTTQSIQINGIRVNRHFIQITRTRSEDRNSTVPPFYEILESRKINMAGLVVNNLENPCLISGIVPSKDTDRTADLADLGLSGTEVAGLSIYPHHSRVGLLGLLFTLMGGQKGLAFHHLIASHAMLTLIVPENQVSNWIALLAEGFDLPSSHTPFEQADNDEVASFVRRKYDETRATYVEKRIKTYGMGLIPGLILNAYTFTGDGLVGFGTLLRSMDPTAVFAHVSARMTPDRRIFLYLLSKEPLPERGQYTRPAEMLHFHGPHFGDRYGIMSRTLRCLDTHQVPVYQAGCTGASIHLILPENRGLDAKRALTDVFDNP